MAPVRTEVPLSNKVFSRLQQTYQAEYGISLYAVHPTGALFFGTPPCPDCSDCRCADARLFAINETLRWGEPTVGFCPGNRLLWAMPVMRNQRLLGGIIASVSEKRVFSSGTARPLLDIRQACIRLREQVENQNLSNAAVLELKRQEYYGEQQRAYAIHSFKEQDHNSIREIYLREEPALFAAIRAGDRGEARGILNRILLVIHYHAGERLDLIKSMFLELVVSMCRTAVEAGGRSEELLGANFVYMSDLAKVQSEEALTSWLRHILEHLMDAIEQRRSHEPDRLLVNALNFMRQHCHRSLSRDEVARAVHLSPSYFSALMRQQAGVPFTELLNRMRIDQAAELLAIRDWPLAAIAERCGFRDQSYFTKVFKRYRKVSPLQYRKDLRAARSRVRSSFTEPQRHTTKQEPTNG